MSEKETAQDKKINAARVAEIWNERARQEKKVESHYTRFSVRSRRDDLHGEETPIGWLYSERQAWKVDLRPRSNQRPDRVNKTPFRRKTESSSETP